LRKLDPVIHKNESHTLKLQRDLFVVILYGSIYTSIKLWKYKIANIVKLSVLVTILSSFIYRCRWVYGGM